MSWPPPPTLAERLATRIKIDDNGCHIYQGKITSQGYGRLQDKKKSIYAHRAAYEIAKGQIPEGLVLDHLCRNRACCNPDHLEPVTDAENFRRGIDAAALRRAKTHCKHGHEFTPENTILARGHHRHCRECSRIRSRNRRKKHDAS